MVSLLELWVEYFTSTASSVKTAERPWPVSSFLSIKWTAPERSLCAKRTIFAVSIFCALIVVVPFVVYTLQRLSINTILSTLPVQSVLSSLPQTIATTNMAARYIASITIRLNSHSGVMVARQLSSSNSSRSSETARISTGIPSVICFTSFGMYG